MWRILLLDRATRPVAPTFHIAPNQVKVWAAAILEGVEADTGIKKRILAHPDFPLRAR